MALLAYIQPTYFAATSSGLIDTAFSLAFQKNQPGPVKISWEDYRGGIFGTASSSACIYRVYIDGTIVGGHRRMNVYGASTMVEDWGTFTFFAPSVAAGAHTVSVTFQSNFGASCLVGGGTGNPNGSTLLVEGY